ncbi:MAG: hypothetical protein SXQ77_12135 [Halobacteria archaeon]|nr:hypothetical protein [Halobacteria archaeon]
MADDNDSRIDRRKQELEEGGEDSNLTTYVAIVGIVAVVAVVGFVFMQGGSSPEEGVMGNITAGNGQDPTMVSSTTSATSVVRTVPRSRRTTCLVL